MEKFILILISMYFGYLFYEKMMTEKRRKKLKYVIHINGIRGKSTTSRLIDAGMRARGYKVFTKITGTSPRIIDTFGEEKEILRKGKANIREQIKAIKWADRENAEVLVLECMAVNPELQNICENKILKADICVITNVREDHLDEMGETLDEIAKSLSNTMPTNGVLFTSDKKYVDFFREIGNKKGTKVFLAEEKEEYREIDFPSNVAVALAVCKYAGVDEKKALERMRNYYKDPGCLKTLCYKNQMDKKIYFVNAMAANDPNSTEIILENISKKDYFKNRKYLLINNRKDRVSRWEQYIKFAKKMEERFDKIIVSGESKDLFYKYITKENISKDKIEILEDKNYFDKIDEDILIVAVGNICGYGKSLVEYIEKKGEVVDG
ncbi:MAG: poly-gamma-glutamate synthase PgsB [Fusobacterium sp.]|uniref:poly-gamma-glutamate synthase PgsB n=1 Tax=Fusobacterium sp. TaxID=68766 RepID=UPI002A74D70D|nr:poly-gamma-glutamate synthase PgsB [Fusobacterium sp.]MDY2981699.1 poly-gamma-glutamate synthase PgsB [Fusobacterium sp.]